MERRLGEVFHFRRVSRFISLEVCGADNCEGCIFLEVKSLLGYKNKVCQKGRSSYIGECKKDMRSDKQNVIFKEVKR